jgi:pimeloyl-ACP methyl ester carboxylesterase
MWASFRASRRALVLVAVVLDRRLLSRLVSKLTDTPRSEVIKVDGVPVEVLRPGGDGPWPAWLFVNGAHPERRREPVVTRLAHGLARAGFLVLVPDLPGLGEGTITARTVEATATVTSAAAARPDVRAGRVALIGASTGAGLALVTAGRDELADRISVVAAVAPYANLDKLVCMATTSFYEDEAGFERYGVTDLHREVVASSLLAAAGEPGRPAVDALLANAEPERFAELYAALPVDVRTLVERLSPLRVAARIEAPVEVIVPPQDEYFPLGEARALAAAIPDARLTITATLDHTRPSLGRLRDFRSFLGFVVRGLSAADAR